MANLANLTNNAEALDSITALEKELTNKLGKDVALVAYSPVSYADLGTDEESLKLISDLEKKFSEKTGKNIVLVAFAV